SILLACLKSGRMNMAEVLQDLINCRFSTLPVTIIFAHHWEKGELTAMAKESFDKEIQFLRMLALTSGAYSRQQFAERLGISVHTFDKTLRRLKEIVSSMYQQLPQEQGKEFAEAIRFNYYESS